MASPKNSCQKLSLSRPVTYEYWSDWFDGLTLTYDEHDDTDLTGPVADQAALHGLLKKVGDLALPLISVNPVERCGSVRPTEADGA
jgi:hypothetical protein